MASNPGVFQQLQSSSGFKVACAEDGARAQEVNRQQGNEAGACGCLDLSQVD